MTQLETYQVTITAARLRVIEQAAYELQVEVAPRTLTGKALHLALLQHNAISYSEYSILRGYQ